MAQRRQSYAGATQREEELLAEITALKAQLAIRDELIHEVNHRAKNNLQMAVSVLNMRWHTSRDPQVREVLRDASERLSYIAAVHEMLYEEPAETQTVELLDYLTRMREHVVQARGVTSVDIRVAGDELVIGGRCAANLALIACEAISNAYKYAFPGGRGVIRLTISRNGSSGALTITDDGVGLPAARRPGSIGIRVMSALARAIGGSVSLESSDGTRVGVIFPL